MKLLLQTNRFTSWVHLTAYDGCFVGIITNKIVLSSESQKWRVYLNKNKQKAYHNFIPNLYYLVPPVKKLYGRYLKLLPKNSKPAILTVRMAGVLIRVL